MANRSADERRDEDRLSREGDRLRDLSDDRSVRTRSASERAAELGGVEDSPDATARDGITPVMPAGAAIGPDAASSSSGFGGSAAGAGAAALALDTSDFGQDDIKPGWPVVTLDDVRFGEVDEVGPERVLVDRNDITGKIYIPYTGIRSLDDKTVHLNVPSSEVESQDWQQVLPPGASRGGTGAAGPSGPSSTTTSSTTSSTTRSTVSSMGSGTSTGSNLDSGEGTGTRRLSGSADTPITSDNYTPSSSSSAAVPDRVTISPRPSETDNTERPGRTIDPAANDAPPVTTGRGVEEGPTSHTIRADEPDDKSDETMPTSRAYATYTAPPGQIGGANAEMPGQPMEPPRPLARPTPITPPPLMTPPTPMASPTPPITPTPPKEMGPMQDARNMFSNVKDTVQGASKGQVNPNDPKEAFADMFSFLENIPNSFYYLATVTSVLASLVLFLTGKRWESIFVGLWAPTIVSASMFYKLLRPSQEVRRM